MRSGFGLAAALLAMPVLAQSGPTSLIGVSVRASDLERSLRFYRDGLGMVVVFQMDISSGKETMLGFSKEKPQPGIILMTETKSRPVVLGNGYSRTVLRVAGIAAMADRLKKAGYVPTPIKDVRGGYRMMMVSDPDGYAYEIVESKGRASGTK